MFLVEGDEYPPKYKAVPVEGTGFRPSSWWQCSMAVTARCWLGFGSLLKINRIRVWELNEKVKERYLETFDRLREFLLLSI
jgi:hypothetical protein